MGLGQPRLDQNGPSLGPGQEPAPGPVRGVEHLGVLELGVVGNPPLSTDGRRATPANRTSQNLYS